MFLLIALFATVINGLPLSHMEKTNLAWDSGLQCVECDCSKWDGHNYSNCEERSKEECRGYCVKCQADGTTPMPGFWTGMGKWCQRYTDGCLHLATKDHVFDKVDGYCCQDDHKLSDKVCCQHGPKLSDTECPKENMDLEKGQMMGKGVACDDGTELEYFECARVALDMGLCDTSVSRKNSNSYPPGCSYKPADSTPCSKHGGRKLYWNEKSESSYLKTSTTHSKQNLCKPAKSEDEDKCELDEQKLTLMNDHGVKFESCCKYSHTRYNDNYDPEECCDGPTENVKGKDVCPEVPCKANESKLRGDCCLRTHILLGDGGICCDHEQKSMFGTECVAPGLVEKTETSGEEQKKGLVQVNETKQEEDEDYYYKGGKKG